MASTTDATQTSLTALNASTLGVTMPEVTINGIKVQTGTVASLLMNVKAYDEIITRATDNKSTADDAERKLDLEKKIDAAIPLLVKVGLFDLFFPDEWIGGFSTSPGRKYAGQGAKDYIAHQGAAVKA